MLGGEKAVSGHSDRRRARGIPSRRKDDGDAHRADDPRSERAHRSPRGGTGPLHRLASQGEARQCRMHGTGQSSVRNANSFARLWSNAGEGTSLLSNLARGDYEWTATDVTVM